MLTSSSKLSVCPSTVILRLFEYSVSLLLGRWYVLGHPSGFGPASAVVFCAVWEPGYQVQGCRQWPRFLLNGFFREADQHPAIYTVDAPHDLIRKLSWFTTKDNEWANGGWVQANFDFSGEVGGVKDMAKRAPALLVHSDTGVDVLSDIPICREDWSQIFKSVIRCLEASARIESLDVSFAVPWVFPPTLVFRQTYHWSLEVVPACEICFCGSSPSPPFLTHMGGRICRVCGAMSEHTHCCGFQNL